MNRGGMVDYYAQNRREVFNTQLMECQNATILYPQDPTQCALPASRSTADRTDQTIRIVMIVSSQ
eukprot:1544819-Amphidinium_carterae.1